MLRRAKLFLLQNDDQTGCGNHDPEDDGGIPAAALCNESKEPGGQSRTNIEHTVQDVADAAPLRLKLNISYQGFLCCPYKLGQYRKERGVFRNIGK